MGGVTWFLGRKELGIEVLDERCLARARPSALVRSLEVEKCASSPRFSPQP